MRWTNFFGITYPEKTLQSHREVSRMTLKHITFTPNICLKSASLQEATHE